ncbi:multicopper oxidase domain-containing protein [Streptomyces sp. NPDC047108]|uniref:multicopper oxidase domain-containing protein n=1 Tax=Streptomyces sp. NPDC047108 TaxID=3155025 RepID=UPI0033E6C7DE
MPRRTFSRRFFAGGAAAAAISPMAFGAQTAHAQEAAETEAVGAARGTAPRARTKTPARAAAGGKVRRLKLYAEKMPDGRLGFGLAKGKATVPGPLIEMTEGDTLHVEFTNLMDEPVSLHVHGVDYDVESDGTRLNRSCTDPGKTRVYTWRTHTPGVREDGTWRAGSAGYWHYHDHAVGTDHGTGGIHKGLYGGLIVRRKGDILPDRQFTLCFNDTVINNGPGHEGPDLKVKLGDRVEIVVITHGRTYHTFHMHGHRWAENRTGLLTGADDPSRVIDNKITGPGDSFGFQIIAGENIGAGAWMYHCHVQSHADMGMSGLILVTEADGTLPGYDPHGLAGHGPRAKQQGSGAPKKQAPNVAKKQVSSASKKQAPRVHKH